MIEKMTRSQNTSNTKKRKVLIGIWAEPEVKDEIQRIARKEGLGKGNDLSLSSVGAALLKKQLQQHIDMGYGAMIEPVIERCIDRKMDARDAEYIRLLARIAYDVGRVRSMTTNILGRQEGMNKELFETICKESSNTAIANITKITPKIKKLQNIIKKRAHEGKPTKEEN